MHKKFQKLFAGYERAHGAYRLSKEEAVAGKKQGGKATTIIEPVTELHWINHLNGSDGLGIIMLRDDGLTCMFGAIDVDTYDMDLKALEATVLKHELPLVVCRTKSGGAHLYLFGKEPLPVTLLRIKLMEISDALGLGDSEVFPKQVERISDEDTGSWINIPYFGAEKTTRYALHKGMPLSPAAFINHARSVALTANQLEYIKIPDTDSNMDDAPPCLSKLCSRGFPDGTRNSALFSLGVYARQKYGDDWEGVLDTMNQQYMVPQLGASEVIAVVKSLKRKKYFYKCNDQPLLSECNKGLCRQRKYGVGGSDEDIPFEMGTLIKIETEPPLWYTDVNGVRIELTTEELMSQPKFHKVCINAGNFLPIGVKGRVWTKMINDKLKTVEIVQAPPDAGPRGQLLMHLHAFISTGAPAKQKEMLLNGQRYEADGRVYFRSMDLFSFLERRKWRAFAPNRIYATLRAKDVGGKHHDGTFNGTFLNYWSIPNNNRQIEEFTQPEMVTTEEPF